MWGRRESCAISLTDHTRRKGDCVMRNEEKKNISNKGLYSMTNHTELPAKQ